ncbi:neuromedin-U receptor 1 isoform X2 [Manis javanica]|uniref:neuromedin-U receptor 1 isoform X2 n=1 Tax=Manis javanica TaxID=9974 RepID=UPI003C6CFFA5
MSLGDARSLVPCNGSSTWGFFDPENLNLTDEELRLKYLGPQKTELFTPICATYLLIFAVGTVGNGMTCMVILRHKTMHTPTNYYLFSLAVSDLLVLLVGLPLELYEMWCNYPFLLGVGGCYFRTLLFETVCLASVLNVTALSVERYLAVVHPLQARSMVTPAHVRRVLGAIWGLAVLCSLPNTSLHGIRQLDVPCRGTVPGSAICTLVRPLALYNLVVQTTALLFFCLPMATISVLYLLIGLQLQRERLLPLGSREAKGRAKASNSYRLQRLQDRGRTQVTKMLCSEDVSSTPASGASVTPSLPGPPGHLWFRTCVLLIMTASFLLCCLHGKCILQPHLAFLVLFPALLSPNPSASPALRYLSDRSQIPRPRHVAHNLSQYC